MRRLVRLGLEPSTQRMLKGRTRKVQAAEDPKAEASRLWNNKRASAWKDIRQKLCAMCSGVERCMYCEDSGGTDIEHFHPKAIYPEKAFRWENYLYACSLCNSNEKREQFPLDPRGRPLLIDPTVEEPSESLEFSPTTGKYVPLDGRGKASRDVFGLNRSRLTTGRRNAWHSIQALIVQYARLKDEGDPGAEGLGEALRKVPLSGVAAAIVRVAASDVAEIVRAECRRALAERPEIRRWFSVSS